MNKPKWELLKADRSWSNESNGAEMAGCISEAGRVVAYLPNHFKDAPLLCAAPELLEALERMVRAFNVKEIEPLVAFVTIEQARAAIAKAKGEA